MYLCSVSQTNSSLLLLSMNFHYTIFIFFYLGPRSGDLQEDDSLFLLNFFISFFIFASLELSLFNSCSCSVSFSNKVDLSSNLRWLDYFLEVTFVFHFLHLNINVLLAQSWLDNIFPKISNLKQNLSNTDLNLDSSFVVHNSLGCVSSTISFAKIFTKSYQISLSESLNCLRK